MFGTIRRHQTWLWAVIITLTVISFVIYFSPYSKMNSGGGRPSGNYGSINGQKVTRQQFAEAYREVDLHFFLVANPGHWLNEDRKRSEQDIDREVYHWLLLTQKEDQLGIHASGDAAAEMGRQLMHPFERMGVTSPSIFIQKVLEPHGYQVSDFERYIRHFLGIQELMSTFGLSGRLITPEEAKTLYQRDHQEVATEVLFFSASNYLAKVSVTPEAVAQFYSNRVANYIIPDRVQVSYVAYAITNFLSEAQTELGTNLNDLVEANYQRLGTNLNALFPEAKTPEEYKAKIRERVIRERATADAGQKANVFAHTLMDSQSTRLQSFDELAKTNGLTVGVTAPFDREDGPKDVEVGPEFTKMAFALTPEEPFNGPVLGRDAVYVVALQKRIPHETPVLDQIRDRVTADYKQNQALMLARQEGASTYQIFTNRLAQGSTFVGLCDEAKMTMIAVAPFSISTRSLGDIENLVSMSQLKQAAFNTPPGKLSPFQPTSSGGMLLYVKAKLPVDTAKMETDLPAYVNNLRATRQSEAFNEWLRKEADKGLRDTPAGRPTPPPAMGTAAKS
jgi:peptidyl-prolyl cis-trans isomerase D